MISYGRRHTVKVEGKNNETKVVKQDDESKTMKHLEAALDNASIAG